MEVEADCIGSIRLNNVSGAESGETKLVERTLAFVLPSRFDGPFRIPGGDAKGHAHPISSDLSR